jgi:hypothetical protein
VSASQWNGDCFPPPLDDKLFHRQSERELDTSHWLADGLAALRSSWIQSLGMPFESMPLRPLMCESAARRLTSVWPPKPLQLRRGRGEVQEDEEEGMSRRGLHSLRSSSSTPFLLSLLLLLSSLPQLVALLPAPSCGLSTALLPISAIPPPPLLGVLCGFHSLEMQLDKCSQVPQGICKGPHPLPSEAVVAAGGDSEGGRDQQHTLLLPPQAAAAPQPSFQR